MLALIVFIKRTEGNQGGSILVALLELHDCNEMFV